MTLRDLTPRQVYNLQRRMEKERKQYIKRLDNMGACYNNDAAWRAAYDKGLKAGLEFATKI